MSYVRGMTGKNQYIEKLFPPKLPRVVHKKYQVKVFDGNHKCALVK